MWTDALSLPKPPRTDSLSFSSKGLSCPFSTHHPRVEKSGCSGCSGTRMLSPLVWQPLHSPSPPFVAFVGLGYRARFCSRELPPLVPIHSAAVACYDGEKIIVVQWWCWCWSPPFSPLSFVPRISLIHH